MRNRASLPLMAAGAPRHGAPRKSHGSTRNVLQALGVAGGGLLAVSVMTTIAGGPATPSRLVAESPSRSVGATPVAAVAARGSGVVVRPPSAVVVTATATIWSVGGSPPPRAIGPTIPAPRNLTPATPPPAASP